MEASSTNMHHELIEKCRDNDPKAQLEIYKLFFKPMYNTSYRILNNTADAEDIMQDSFLDAFRKIGDYSGEGSFAGWLRRIVVNNSIDALKKKKELVPLEEKDLGMEPDELTEMNQRENTAEYRVDEIRKAISKLPDDARVIISLYLLEGYDHEEISQILDISYNAARTRYSRAKNKLINMLNEQRKMKMFNPN